MIRVENTNDGWVFLVDSLLEIDKFFADMGMLLVRHTDSTDLWLYGFVNNNPVYLRPLYIEDEEGESETDS